MRLFVTLQEVLAERDAPLSSGGRHVRMRAGLNVGPVLDPGPGNGSAAVIGGAVITTHRLLDAPEVRDLQTRSDPGQTFVAVALSQRVYVDVLRTECVRLPSSLLVARQAGGKEYVGMVHLYVLRPSGDLLAHGFGTGSEAAPLGPGVPRLAGTTNVITGGDFGTAIRDGAPAQRASARAGPVGELARSGHTTFVWGQDRVRISVSG